MWIYLGTPENKKQCGRSECLFIAYLLLFICSVNTLSLTEDGMSSLSLTEDSMSSSDWKRVTTCRK